MTPRARVSTLVIAAAAAGLFACGRKPEPTAKPYAQPNGFFSVLIPRGWRLVQELAPPEPGVQLLSVAAKSEAESPASASILFYPKGNPDFPTPSGYVRAHSSAGEGPASSIVIAGASGWEFSAQSPAPSSPEKRISAVMTEKAVVLPAPAGFFVLACASSDINARPCDRDFQEILESFKPGPESQAKAARREASSPRH